MARKLVAVHCMHQHELNTARQALQRAEVGRAFVLGEIDSQGIEALRQGGLIVEELEDVLEKPPVWGLTFLSSPGSEGLKTPDAPSAPTPSSLYPIPKGVTPPQQTRQDYVLTLAGPLLPGWHDELKKLGLEVSRRVARFAFLLSGPAGLTARLQGLPFVRKVVAQPVVSWPPGQSGHLGDVSIPFLGEEKHTPKGDVALQTKTFDVLLKSPQAQAPFEELLRKEGAKVIASTPGKLRVGMTASLRWRLASHPQVEEIEEYLPPVLYNDLTRVLLGIDPASPSAAGPPWTGKGQLVAVADSGIDLTHPDLKDRIHKALPLGRKDDPSDPDGHGTHVAGSIVGTGAASSGLIRGVAPEARLVFQSLMDDQGKLGGLPLRLGDLFEQSYQEGARIHNDSWGADAKARYTLSSKEVDEYVSLRRDMLVVLAAGNAGTAANNVHSPAGFSDLQSVGAPASCKNALVVGASRSSRTKGGRSQRTYKEYWSERFIAPPLSEARISGDPECLAAFSSRGSCVDQRIKPDLVAPGTDILSTRASTAPLHKFWAPAKGTEHYAYLGGTSMAAPFVSGCAALVREYYASVPHEPSAALLKATLINGTRWLTGEDAVLEREVPPNNHQGFGRVSMRTTLPNPAEPWMKLAFIDSWRKPELQLPATNEMFLFSVQVREGHPLRVCLAHTDPPANGMQNTLRLTVQSPNGRKWLGNGKRSSQGVAIWDDLNNVSIVRFEAPEAGRYFVQVEAWNLLKIQDYALVVTGELESGLEPVKASNP
ncbi:MULTISPECIES: S8 family serine peptidase [unclassified Corallococcus]|uniref:S8 family serine peptidase n=1 Tax=unclassified Corallococcus TaxID=2685029 RepID=UPI001A8F1805|nr:MULTISPECIES: S8 family serine peptidase [unclassified Corallococcus]MBN9685190.1 S8 family serine peptidase [Corallococcus sp. NCSPR001]WAS83351.1 S8 family serine peptidase [Corallococcus sp. NCRR]